MDNFGVLVHQTFGIRPQGKSAPMAASKSANNNNQDPLFSTSKPNPNSGSDQFDDPFGFGFNDHKPRSYANVDFSQMPGNSFNGGGGGGFDFDIEAVLKGSNTKAKAAHDDDLDWGFGGQVGSNGGVGVGGSDLLSSDPGFDFLDSLGGIGSGSRLSENKGSIVGDDIDGLISGFGMSSFANDRAQASSTQKSSGSSSIEELEDFGSGRTKKKASGNLDVFKINIPKNTFKTKSVEPNFNFIDMDTDIEGFGGGSIHQEKVESVSHNIFEAEAPDLDSIFEVYSQKRQPLSEETTKNVKTGKVPDPVSIKKNISPGNFHDDFPFFGVASTSSQFEEFEGESKDRRSARLAHYQSTQARMAEALADLNQREFRAQQEQEERHRIAEAMEMDIKRWAAGKEGNLRALLSSLQQVLAPELGWKAVTLTDLITSSQVKIAYKKAALCVHPDKVQQKGANLQQKYVAEKVFDFLKEAWNKFNSEELR